MAKLQILKLLLLTSVSLHAQEFSITITSDATTQKLFGENWQAVQANLDEALQPLAEKIKTTQEDQCLNIYLSKDPKKRGYLLKITDAFGCLDFGARFKHNKNNPTFLIKNIDVGEKYRNKGIGRACITTFGNSNIALLLGYKSLSLKSLPSARGFYKALGFTYIGGEKIVYENESDDDNLYKFSKQVC